MLTVDYLILKADFKREAEPIFFKNGKLAQLV